LLYSTLVIVGIVVDQNKNPTFVRAKGQASLYTFTRNESAARA